ncbi:KamA family radical SAM protein [Desulfobacterales bacterium HSG16]|nr:KamA family radical SAM protein [Desulfobacterales bacterium HSG16]
MVTDTQSRKFHHRNISSDLIHDWKSLVSSSIRNPEKLASFFPPDTKREDMRKIDEVITRYPMQINPYYMSLIKGPDDPVWKQAVPHIAEITDFHATDDDPLCEEDQSPVPNLVHRYPDRVLFLVSARCAVYCRHCMRKRKVGHPATINSDTIEAGIAYIREHEKIQDVLLSGGDPLMLEDEDIYKILTEVRNISHVETIRIHTRTPCTLPQRITPELCRMLKKFHPLYVNTHFNHPAEITTESKRACEMLADSGIPTGCQTVLLKGVNDDAEVMISLMKKLISIRVRPYYIHQTDMVRGTGHFHVPVAEGLGIMQKLRGHVSGICVPQFMIDLPGGGGKIPLLPEYIVEKSKKKWLIKNFEGEIFEYPLY